MVKLDLSQSKFKDCLTDAITTLDKYVTISQNKFEDTNRFTTSTPLIEYETIEQFDEMFLSKLNTYSRQMLFGDFSGILNDVFSNLCNCDNSTITDYDIINTIVYHNISVQSFFETITEPIVTNPQEYNLNWIKLDFLDENELFVITNPSRAITIYENTNDHTYGIKINPWVKNNEPTKCERIIKVVIMK